MRKEEIRTLVVYTIMIAAALIVGFTALRDTIIEFGPSENKRWWFLIVVVVITYIVNAVGLELMHVLGGLIGGYKVTGINILGFGFYKREKNWKFSFRDFDGVTGETVLAPKKEKLNPNLQTWFAIFGYAAEIAACVVVSSIIKNEANTKSGWLVSASVIVILVSSMFFFYNIMPLKLDTSNDGYKMRLFSKPVNVKAYNETLSIQERKRLGETIKELPVYEEVTEYTAEFNMLAMYKMLEDDKLSEAETIIDKLLDHKKVINYIDYNRLIAQKLYLVILTKDLTEAKDLYEKICPTEVRRLIANDNSMASIRAYVMIAGMIEDSESEVEFAKTKVEKAKKRALQSEIVAEEKLLEKAIDYVYKSHPKWKKEKAAE